MRDRNIYPFSPLSNHPPSCIILPPILTFCLLSSPLANYTHLQLSYLCYYPVSPINLSFLSSSISYYPLFYHHFSAIILSPFTLPLLLSCLSYYTLSYPPIFYYPLSYKPVSYFLLSYQHFSPIIITPILSSILLSYYRFILLSSFLSSFLLLSSLLTSSLS